MAAEDYIWKMVPKGWVIKDIRPAKPDEYFSYIGSDGRLQALRMATYGKTVTIVVERPKLPVGPFVKDGVEYELVDSDSVRGFDVPSGHNCNAYLNTNGVIMLPGNSPGVVNDGRRWLLKKKVNPRYIVGEGTDREWPFILADCETHCTFCKVDHVKEVIARFTKLEDAQRACMAFNLEDRKIKGLA